MNKKGFTLIELMVVVGMVGLISVTVTSVFFAISRSQQQASLKEEIKQDGNSTLTGMSKLIRNATTLTCPDNSQISLTMPDGASTTFICSATSIASSSANPVTLIQIPGSGSGNYFNTDNYEIDCTNFAQTCTGSQVEINFQIKPIGSVSTSLPYQKVNFTFNTSVNPRNLR